MTSPSRSGATDAAGVALLALGVVVVVVVVVTGSFSTAAFGTYNPDWDGTSSFRGLADETGTEPTVVLRTPAYTRANSTGSVAVVLAPATSYDAQEADRVGSFVRDGGTLVVAADGGTGVDPANDLLAAVGARARLDGRPLRDDYRHDRGPAMPVAPRVADHPLTRGVDTLTLNRPTVVRPRGARPLVRTSGNAYLDVDADGQFDGTTVAAEVPTSYTVVAVESVGGGRVVTIGDPSVLVNAMLDRPGNERFAQRLFAGNERVLIDHSNRPSPPPLRVGVAALRRSTSALVAAGLVGALALGIISRFVDRTPRRPRL